MKKLLILLTALLLCLTPMCLAEEEEEVESFFFPPVAETETVSSGQTEAPARPAVSDEVLMRFFENSVFVGDSVSQRFRTYTKDRRVEEPGFLSDAKFITVQSYLLFNASKNYVSTKTSNLTYQGREMSLCMIMGQMKPKRVFILLGVNDYIGEKIDKGMEYVERTVQLIHKYSPDTLIYFQSLTPVTRQFCLRKDYRTMWDQYNQSLERLSETVDFTYIDIATKLKDEDGYLPSALSTDGEYHLNNRGVDVWVEQLLDFVRSQYEQGLWSPED